MVKLSGCIHCGYYDCPPQCGLDCYGICHCKIIEKLSRVKIGFKKQDCWVGAYWDKSHLWICLIPCFFIRITFRGKSD